jgi:hypothetical protein
VETLRWVLVGVAAVYWVCCLAVHVVVAATLPGPLPGYSFAYWFVLTIVVGGVVLNVTKPPGRGENAPAPRWYIPVIGAFSLICGVWPMAVGSGVPNSPSLRGAFEDTGVPSGPPGDRELHSHGRRVRAITEEEYQRVEAWDAVERTGFVTAVAGITLAAALHGQQIRRTPNQSPRQTAAAVSVSGSS